MLHNLPAIVSAGVAVTLISGAANNAGFVYNISHLLIMQFSAIDHINAGIYTMYVFLISSASIYGLLFCAFTIHNFFSNNKLKFKTSQEFFAKQLIKGLYDNAKQTFVLHDPSAALYLIFAAITVFIIIVNIINSFVQLQTSQAFAHIFLGISLLLIIFTVVNSHIEKVYKNIIIVCLCLVWGSFGLGSADSRDIMRPERTEISFGKGERAILLRKTTSGAFIAKEKQDRVVIYFVLNEAFGRIEFVN